MTVEVDCLACLAQRSLLAKEWRSNIVATLSGTTHHVWQTIMRELVTLCDFDENMHLSALSLPVEPLACIALTPAGARAIDMSKAELTYRDMEESRK